MNGKLSITSTPMEGTTVQVKLFTYKGWVYVWNSVNQTVQVFVTGASSGTILTEAALGAHVAFDGTITFEALLLRAKS